MKLFTAFADRGYHSSIITTFGIDFEAYEAMALPRLRDAGCNNNIVVADARMLGQALANEAHRPRFAGRRYSVVGASCAGVFHPKLILQLGKTSGRLLVSSANMTSAGMAGNLEVLGEVALVNDDASAAPLLRAAVDYLLQFLAPGSVARAQVEWALRRARWLPASTSVQAAITLQDGLKLAFMASNDAKGIAERFIEFVGERTVRRLVVASPYWDMDLRALRSLERRLAAKTSAVLIQPQTALFPVQAHSPSGGRQLFDLAPVAVAASRFAHAKVFIAETETADCVLFGSANCTQAALGTVEQAGINEEVCLARELPPGQAVQLLGLEEALTKGAELAASDVPSFAPGDVIPLEELAAKLPGRFEMSGHVLRWWPPASLHPGAAAVQLLDHHAAPIPGKLTRVGAGDSPACYHFEGEVAPHFALVSQGELHSSLAVVLVEQAIQQTQRRAGGRGVESALELLDDDDAVEGLWLLEVIQRLTEAEHDLRGARGGQPQHKPAEEVQQDSQVLSYEAFVAGRRTDSDQLQATTSLLASSHHESVRGFLNALIGRRAALGLEGAPEDEEGLPDFGMGDETSDGAAAIELGNVQDALRTSPAAGASDEMKRKLQQRQRFVQDTQRSIADAVESFLKSLREPANAQSLDVVDLLRLRALLIVVLGAGSKKVQLLPTDLNAPMRRQVLPSRGEVNWRGCVGRLLFEFFRDHNANRPPLVTSLRLPADDQQGMPEDVLECWATCFWAVCATRVATDDAGAPFTLADRDHRLAADLYRFSRLLPQQTLGELVCEVFEGMNHRYAERLGTNPARIEQEHKALAAASRTTPAAVLV